MSILINSPYGSKSICRFSRFVLASLKFTTKRVSEGAMTFLRSSSFRLTRPSPRANSARSPEDTFGTAL